MTANSLATKGTTMVPLFSSTATVASLISSSSVSANTVSCSPRFPMITTGSLEGAEEGATDGFEVVGAMVGVAVVGGGVVGDAVGVPGVMVGELVVGAAVVGVSVGAAEGVVVGPEEG